MNAVALAIFSILATVIIEMAVFGAFGWRSRDFRLASGLLNAVTNSLLSLAINLTSALNGPVYLVFALGELSVTAVETAVLLASFGRSVKLAAATVTANLISCGFGLLITVALRFI